MHFVQQGMQQQAGIDGDDIVERFRSRLPSHCLLVCLLSFIARACIPVQPPSCDCKLHVVTVPVVEQSRVVGQGDEVLHRRIGDETEPAELVGDDFGFQHQLPLIANVLPLTAAALAGSEVGTGWLDAVGRCLQDVHEPGSRPARLLLDDLDFHDLAGDGVGHENDLAFMLAKGLAAVGDAGEGESSVHRKCIVSRHCQKCTRENRRLAGSRGSEGNGGACRAR